MSTAPSVIGPEPYSGIVAARSACAYALTKAAASAGSSARYVAFGLARWISVIVRAGAAPGASRAVPATRPPADSNATWKPAMVAVAWTSDDATM